MPENQMIVNSVSEDKIYHVKFIKGPVYFSVNILDINMTLDVDTYDYEGKGE